MKSSPRSLLNSLRYCPQPEPGRFLQHHPGCWILLRPDDPACLRYQPRLSRRFSQDEIDEFQNRQWGVHFTAQLYGASLAARDLLCLRTLVVDVRLAHEKSELRLAEVERRKERYLRDTLARFPLQPHWLIETLDRFQALYRVQSATEPKAIREALELQRQLSEALQGRPFSDDLHLVRLPGTLQFSPAGPLFFCRLLEDRSASVQPYALDEVRRALESRQTAGPRHPSNAHDR